MLTLHPYDIPLNRDVIVNPILTDYTFFEKVRSQTIPSPHGYGKFRISVWNYSVPVLIPEACCMLSLDTASRSIGYDFEEKKTDFKGVYSKNEIIVAKLYNFDSSSNRVVSWGNYSFRKIREEYYNLYMKSFVMDLMITPSVYEQGGLWSPLRWFKIFSQGKYGFEAILNYNIAILYIKKSDVEAAKKMTLYIGQPVETNVIECGFVKISRTGYVGVEKTTVFYTGDISEIIDYVSSEGSYFISSLVSMNNYKTSTGHTTGNHFINIIDTLSPLIYSYYDILMHLFPHFVEPDSLSQPCIKFNVPVSVVDNVISRFTKFGENQSSDMIENFNGISQQMNPFFEVSETTERVYKVRMVNPAVIQLAMKKYLSENQIISRHSEEVMDNVHNLIKEFESPDKLASNIFFTGHHPVVDESRIKNIKNYLEVFRKSGQSL